MNNCTTYVILAVLAAAGTLSTPAFGVGELACPDCVDEPVSKIDVSPVIVWTDSEAYDHESIIMVNGAVDHIRQGVPVTLQVFSPLGNLVTIAQLTVDSDGKFVTTLNTSGPLWKYDGTYIIVVTYGPQEVNNKVLVELTGGIIPEPTISEPPVQCGASELSATGACVPFSITGATATGAWFSSETNSLTVKISSFDDGTLTVNPSGDAISGIFMVLVDGQEWDDVKINGNDVTIMFPAGTEEIEIIGTFAIPEFGTITALILAVAIISIIAVSAKTRLSVMPKY